MSAMTASVRLKKGKEAIFARRHLWIFSGAIASFPDDFKQGQVYPISAADGSLLGHGYFHQGISLSGRILSFGSVAPLEALYSALDHAIALRDNLFNPQITNCFRLVNGEGDFLPGLVIDQYGDHLILQSSTLGIDLLKEKIVDFLLSKKRYKGIHEKSTSSSRKEEKLPGRVDTLAGEAIDELTAIENGITFHLNWRTGQKTGFFLDQREMRKKIGELSRGKRVFNAFSYTGGFSLYALKGGATQVDSLDISAPALELARKNIEANNLPLNRCQFFAEDAFSFLTDRPLDYDLVILDPPAFAKKERDISAATKGYRQINHAAISRMPPGSLLLTCSCSYYIDNALFQTIIFQAARAANRNIQILSHHLPAMDHPVSLFHPESHYLKSLLLRIS